MAPLERIAMDHAARVLDENLGELPRMLAKLLLLGSGFELGPHAHVVRAWCDRHPAAAAQIVGAVAFVQAIRLNGGGSG